MPLAESDARVGLYQMVDHRWNYMVSCDWQCKPPRVHREPEPATADDEKMSAVLSEADAQVGLYQLVDAGWCFVVSCDWQCRPLEDSDQGHDQQLQERSHVSTSSLSTCRDRDDEARPSLFHQTGDIMWTLVGDEGEMGLVMLDELGSAPDLTTVSAADIQRDQEAAEQRKRALAQLFRDLGDDDVCH